MTTVSTSESPERVTPGLRHLCKDIRRLSVAGWFKLIFWFAAFQLKSFLRILRGLPALPTSHQSMTLDAEELALADHYLRNRDRWNDPDIVSDFERAFADWNGSRYAFAFNSGREALSACFEGMGLKPGDEVILPYYTCIVVTNAFQYANISMIPCDIELDTYGLDAALIEEAVTPKTRAILLQHLFGLVCRDYEAILEIAKRHRLKVIEDCAWSTGAEFRGIKVGNRGDVAIYSAHHAKVINTIDGGIVTTQKDEVAENLKSHYSNLDFPKASLTAKKLKNIPLNYYRHKYPKAWLTGGIVKGLLGQERIENVPHEERTGVRPAEYGRRMAAPIAAIGLSQLKKVDAYNAKRRQAAKRWDAWCLKHGYRKPLVIEGSLPVFPRYPVMVEAGKKADPAQYIRDERVTFEILWNAKHHLMMRRDPRFPNTLRALDQLINLPTL